MPDDLIPNPITPNGGSNQNSGGENAEQRKKNRYWKATRIMAFFGVIEAVSLVLWSKAEDFSPQAAFFVRWSGDCGLLAGGAYLAHKLAGENFKRRVVAMAWIAWTLLCIIMYFAKSSGIDELEERPLISLEVCRR